MLSESNQLSYYRPRLVTLIVLIIVAAPIAVANLSHAERPPQEWPPPNPSYGWPLNWYWCEYQPSTRTPTNEMKPKLVLWSGPLLAANVTIWFGMLAVLGIGCQLLLRRFTNSRRYRPRILTLLVLSVVAAPIVLANLSSNELMFAGPRPSYGWPLIWRWRDVKYWYGAISVLDQNYSAARLTANLAIWLVMLTFTGTACEWWLRRYRPRFRWSLRTMLAAVGLLAALCAWAVALRELANLQDPVILESEQLGSTHLYVERWGPKWLDLVGADRFRRRIVGADIVYYADDRDEEFLRHLRPLPALRYLNLEVLQATPGLAATLGDMPQLRVLRIDDCQYSEDKDAISRDYVVGIAKFTKLAELHLGGIADTRCLAHLASLKNLKSLSLQFNMDVDGEDSDGPSSDGIHLLAHMPALPRLEIVDLLSEWGDDTIDQQDIRQLAALPRLKSLNLSDIRVTDAAFAELASLNSLEQLAISDDATTPARLRSLLALKRLKKLHIQRFAAVNEATLAALPSQESLEERESAGEGMLQSEWALLAAMEGLRETYADEDVAYDKSDRLTTVALYHGDQVFALESEVAGLRRAFEALRKANPGIVIDSDPNWFDRDRGKKRHKVPWEH